MAKMFYNLEEAAAKLGKTEAEVRDMASLGQLTEFRDGDKLIFKVDQVDLVAGDGGSEESGMIPLTDTSSGDTALGLDASDPGLGMDVGGVDVAKFTSSKLEMMDTPIEAPLITISNENTPTTATPFLCTVSISSNAWAWDKPKNRSSTCTTNSIGV